MKTIGLIGGMSWESTLEYYRLINENIKAQLGGLHSAKILMYSVDFAEIEKLQQGNNWLEAAHVLIAIARKLEDAGADCVVICTNTMHKLADEIQCAVKIPLLHIADATGEAIKKVGFTKVGLLGTKFTMEEGFYRNRIKNRYGIDVIIPEENARQIVHEVIYNELCLGTIKLESKLAMQKIIEDLAANGVKAVILGCTEIPLLIKANDAAIPVFDTMKIHAENAVKFALT